MIMCAPRRARTLTCYFTCAQIVSMEHAWVPFYMNNWFDNCSAQYQNDQFIEIENAYKNVVLIASILAIKFYIVSCTLRSRRSAHASIHTPAINLIPKSNSMSRFSCEMWSTTTKKSFDWLCLIDESRKTNKHNRNPALVQEMGTGVCVRDIVA